jgi:opacity protein-like surface antigen
MRSLILALTLVLGLSAGVSAQKAVEPKPSPMALAKASLEGTYVSITYSQPHKKDRVVFGELVPFGKVWRFGANEGTQFTTTGDLMIADKHLKAGTYTVFCVPEKDSWTLHFNTVLGQWGAYQYDASKDVLKVSVKTAATTETWEAFTLKFDKPEGKSTKLNAMWEGTMISVPVKAH